jgi:hypothetical protein
MKNIFILLFLFLTAKSFACSNYLPISEAAKAVALEGGAGSKTCKELPEEECLCFDSIIWESAEIVDEVGNGAPIYTVNNQQSCTLEIPVIEDQEPANTKTDCQLKLEALSCGENFEAILREDLLEVRCTRLDGYEQVLTGRKVLQNNPTKFATYQAQQAAQAQMNAARAQARNLRECGYKVMDLLLVRNASKGLTTTQVKQIVSTYAPIQGLLQSGSLNSAKEEIQAVVADGVLVTEGDKTALVAEIDQCL